ncbi:MAG: ABC transporter ATP-binding protein [Phycisphaerales bacterium]
MPMIETINLCKDYGDLVALDNLNLSINEGDCFGFIGPNGAGKTTTIKILATLLKPSRGQAMINGLTIGYQNRQIRPIIGYVPDFMGAYEDMVVVEYLEFFAAAYDIHGAQRKRVVSDVLDLTDLNYKATAEVKSLSRGMQQRLSIARVLLHDPKVLLMDEPASGLDPRARIEIRELLKELKRMGKTIIISSHILHELAELCNTVGIIERGKLLFNGTVRDVLKRARLERKVIIGIEERTGDAAKLLAGVQGVTQVNIVDGDGETIAAGEHGGRRFIEAIVADDVVRSIGDLPNALVNGGFRITRFSEEQINLETAFMRLTQGLVQ